MGLERTFGLLRTLGSLVFPLLNQLLLLVLGVKILKYLISFILGKLGMLIALMMFSYLSMLIVFFLSPSRNLIQMNFDFGILTRGVVLRLGALID